MKNFVTKIFYFLVGMLFSACVSQVVAMNLNEGVGLFLFFVLSFSNLVSFFSENTAKGNAYQFIGTIASGVGIPTTIAGYKGLPQFIQFTVSTVPQNIRVLVNGRVEILNLDSAGIIAFANPRVVGRAANSYLIPLSNGFQNDLTFDITVVNGVAAAFDVIGISKNYAPVDAPGFFTSLSQTINQGTSVSFDNFKYLGLPNMGATDFISIIGKKRNFNGSLAGGEWNSRIEPNGLISFLSQDESQAVTAKIAIDNYQSEWEQVWFTPQATQKVYVQKLVSADFRGAVVSV